VHPFGATSSPSCASFALNKAIDDCASKFPTSAIETMKGSFYVDDCLFSCNSVEAAKVLIGQFREIAAKGGFNLTRWMSNKNIVLSSTTETWPDNLSIPLDFQAIPVHPT
jgi:hypothetical protein